MMMITHQYTYKFVYVAHSVFTHLCTHIIFHFQSTHPVCRIGPIIVDKQLPTLIIINLNDFFLEGSIILRNFSQDKKI